MFHNKIFNIIFSVLVAVGLWVYVVGEVNPQTAGKFQDIPVRFINGAVLAEEGLALVDPGPQTVSVTVTGTRADVKELKAANIDVTADLSGLKKGENQIKLSVSLPNNMSLQNISADKVRVTIEDLVTEEKPVQITFEGTVPEGKEPGAISYEPETIQVSGAASSVKKTQYVAAVLSVTEITDTPQELEANLKAMDKNGNPVSYLSLSQDQLTVKVTMLETKTVPLKVDIVGSVPEGYVLESQTSPETITIKGSGEDLASIKSISAEPIDISKLKTSANIPIRPNLPKGIELGNASSNPELQLTINPVSAITFTYKPDQLEISGLDAGLAVELPNQSIRLAVNASAEDSAGLVAEDFTLSLDLSGLGVGTHQIPILVETDKKGLDFSTTPKEIQIIIREE